MFTVQDLKICIHIKIHKLIFIASLFRIVPNWKQCSLTGEEINKLWDIIQKKKQLMHLRNIVISKRSQTRRVHILIPFIWNESPEQVKLVDSEENKIGGTWGRRWSRVTGKGHEWAFWVMVVFYILTGVVVTCCIQMSRLSELVHSFYSM